MVLWMVKLANGEQSDQCVPCCCQDIETMELQLQLLKLTEQQMKHSVLNDQFCPTIYTCISVSSSINCRYVKFDTFHPAVDRGLPVTRVISRVVLQQLLAETAIGMAGEDVILNDQNVVDYQHEVCPAAPEYCHYCLNCHMLHEAHIRHQADLLQVLWLSCKSIYKSMAHCQATCNLLSRE